MSAIDAQQAGDGERPGGRGRATRSHGIRGRGDEPSAARRIQLGALMGGAAGAGLGGAYGALSTVTDLALGSLPSWAVATAAGAALGIAVGALAGLAGRSLLSKRALAGFVAAVAMLSLGRMADDTGFGADKLLDIAIGGAFWGVAGASLAALFAGGGEAEN